MASDARRRGVGTQIGKLAGQVPLGRRSVRPCGEQRSVGPEFDAGDPSLFRPRSTAEADLTVSAGRADAGPRASALSRRDAGGKGLPGYGP